MEPTPSRDEQISQILQGVGKILQTTLDIKKDHGQAIERLQHDVSSLRAEIQDRPTRDEIKAEFSLMNEHIGELFGSHTENTHRRQDQVLETYEKRLSALEDKA